jgi:beta-N-acetylhexosaminidase
MSLPQRVGQLFMVGTPAVRASRAARSQIDSYHVGGIILTGRSDRGIGAVRHVVARMQRQTTRRATVRVPLLVATDQEGGAVQVLRGRGLSHIPAALHQGTWSRRQLSRRAGHWAGQLHRAGVNMNLAPVLDTVPGPRAARHNAPIGAYGREYGFMPGTVSRHGATFVRAMARHGVGATAKHFPGLGRVRRNTDYAARVTDRWTRRHDPYLAPFRKAVRAGVPFVMVSTADYRHLDRGQPAAFSRFVLRTMLRHDLGFRGVVVSDDLARARQVGRWSLGQRAVKFLSAGGDLALVTSPRALPGMYDAVLHRARRDRAFRSKVRHAALLVLRAKQQLHLLP